MFDYFSHGLLVGRVQRSSESPYSRELHSTRLD
jgi:hypothetical protein